MQNAMGHVRRRSGAITTATSATQSGTTSTTSMQWGPTTFAERNGARTTAQWGNDDGHECDAERHDKYDAEGKGINGMSAEHQEQDEVEIMYEKVDYAKRKEFNDA